MSSYIDFEGDKQTDYSKGMPIEISKLTIRKETAIIGESPLQSMNMKSILDVKSIIRRSICGGVERG